MGGSGRASGPEFLQQAAPALSASPAATVWPKPGSSAATASGGRLEGSGAAWGEPRVGEEEEAGSASVGMRFDAAGRPAEEEAEAERWQLGSRSELMT